LELGIYSCFLYTYVLLELIFELNELVEKLGVDVFNAFNTLVMNLIHKVLFWNFLAGLLRSVYSFESLTLLKGRLVDILLLCQSEGKDAIE